MCTVLIAHGVLDDYPVFLAANRDEFYDRASDTPRPRGHAPRRWFGPTDLRAEGTWIGVNEHGLFAVITNRSDLQTPTTAVQRSRGVLVRSILESVTLDEAVARWESDIASDSQPFNLAFGTTSHLIVASRDLRGSSRREVPSGTFAISNFGPPDTTEVGEVRRALEEWGVRRRGGEDPWQAAQAILRSRSDGDRPGLEKDLHDRGTVSSTIMGIAADGRVRYLHAEGAPSKTEYHTTDPVHFGKETS